MQKLVIIVEETEDSAEFEFPVFQSNKQFFTEDVSLTNFLLLLDCSIEG